MSQPHTKEPGMPIVKLLESGRVTLPRELRDEAHLKTGDFMEVTYRDGVFELKPVVTVSSDEARTQIKALLKKSRKAASNLSDKEIDDMVQEAIEATRAQQRSKS